jgi:hypothetical protein
VTAIRARIAATSSSKTQLFQQVTQVNTTLRVGDIVE